MKRSFTKLMAAFALLVFMAPSMVTLGQTRAEVVAYTLDGTIAGSGSNYATENSITQDNISWKVTGNTTTNPWRIGGKSISNVDRPVYSTNPIADNITKIEVTHGTASNITVNSWTVIVASDANFTNVVSTLTPTFAANATTTINRPDGADWTGCYYKFIYNVTVTQTSNRFVQFVKAEFYKQEGSGPVIATPTFSLASGTYIGTQSVTISCETENSTIYYTTDGSTPDNTSTQYNGAITVSGTTTINAIAYVGSDASSVATATYTIVNLEHAGTEADPYSVADARAAIDANVGISGVYATGIVSAIPTAWSTQYNNITFNFVDEEGDSNFLQAYRCVNGDNVNASEVAVGDSVVVYGNLTKYNSTYEFGQGCQLVSLTHPAVAVEAPTFSPVAGTYAEAQSVTISCESPSTVIYYTLDGTEPTVNSTLYSGAISVSSTTTIKAVAYAGGSDHSTVSTANYYICSDEDPYTVTEALAFASYQYPANGIYVTGIVSTAPESLNNGTLTYYISVDGEATDELEVYKGKGLNNNAFTSVGDIQVGDIVTIYGNVQVYNSTIEFGSGNYLVSFERPVPVEPTVTVTPSTINAPAEGAEGTLAVTYEYLTDFASFDIYFCDAEGNELQNDPDWIGVAIQEENDVYSVDYVIDANDGEARTAYFKVYTFNENGNDLEEVYAIVTVNQAQYVVDYAELPFEFDGGRADIENTNGLTQEGLDSDYSSSPKLKFKTTGTWVLLKFNEVPGTLTFDIKGNGFSEGTFTVQTSEDGVTYTDLKVYTDSNFGNTLQPEEFNNLGENVRYIKWIYTEKSNGNVALGNITLAKYVAPTPAITVESTTIEATAEETEGSLNVTYTAIATDLGASIYWYTDNTGTTTADEPSWISANVNETTLNVDYVIAENNGEARTAYFKVYGVDAELNDVYSELVTISQASAPQDYDLTVEPFENLEIITFVNDEMVMEADGTISVTAGAQVMLSVAANEGYVMETLMVNGVDHVNDIADDFTYTFTMPGENVTISATAVEQVAPVGGDYVRITSLDELTDGSIVVIAARYDEEHTNGYYAMSNATSDKPNGVLFTSTTSGDNEILPASIVDNEDEYYWTVNVTENGYTFTNDEGFLIGYNSSTNFATGGNNTEWTIERRTSEGTAMVGGYTGFVIKNKTTNTRAFAFNGSAFGAYATSNMTNATYNFYLDFFVQSESPVTETYTLTINGYGNNDGGWYLIASPVSTTPGQVTNMLTEDTQAPYSFDLYRFNQAAAAEWENYHQHQSDFNIVPGQGYLYANKGDVNSTPNEVTLTFTGAPYVGDGTIDLDYTGNGTFLGWNLVGNPFSETAYFTDNNEFYRMNESRTGIIAEATTGAINKMEGVFVLATGTDQSVKFTTTNPNAKKSGIALNLVQNRGSVIDRAIVRFGNSNTLPKLQLFENSTKLYIPQYGEDFAIVSAEAQGEMPVNFKASENGSYTITINPENVEMNYLHLIDNLTGADVDLMATPSYTFNARTDDYASRFKLVFSAQDSNDMGDDFAFISNGQIILNGANNNATLQVVDMLGRVVSSQTVNGNSAHLAPVANGVYVLRLINGNDVKTQKIVVE